MKKSMVVSPDGWGCTLGDCPPGFFVYEENLCFKSEYGHNEVFCDSGESFWGGCKTKEDLENLWVQPVVVKMIEID